MKTLKTLLFLVVTVLFVTGLNAQSKGSTIKCEGIEGDYVKKRVEIKNDYISNAGTSLEAFEEFKDFIIGNEDLHNVKCMTCPPSKPTGCVLKIKKFGSVYAIKDDKGWLFREGYYDITFYCTTCN